MHVFWGIWEFRFLQLSLNGGISFPEYQGLEDYLGEMDFKIAGTRNLITAIQLDIKLPGVPLNILLEALEPARSARGIILDKMEEELREPRKEKANSPRTGRSSLQAFTTHSC